MEERNRNLCKSIGWKRDLVQEMKNGTEGKMKIGTRLRDGLKRRERER